MLKLEVWKVIEVVRKVAGGFLRVAAAREGGDTVESQILRREDAADAFHKRATRRFIGSSRRF